MLWTPINQKLRHLWKIILTYIAYEANVYTITTLTNYIPSLLFIITLAMFL